MTPRKAKRAVGKRATKARKRKPVVSVSMVREPTQAEIDAAHDRWAAGLRVLPHQVGRPFTAQDAAQELLRRREEARADRAGMRTPVDTGSAPGTEQAIYGLDTGVGELREALDDLSNVLSYALLPPTPNVDGRTGAAEATPCRSPLADRLRGVQRDLGGLTGMVRDLIARLDLGSAG